MVEVRLIKADIERVRDNALLVGFFKDKLELVPEMKKLDEGTGRMLSSFIENNFFTGEKGEMRNIYVNKGVKIVSLLGLGERDKFDMSVLSCAIADSMKKLRDSGMESVSIWLESLNDGKIDMHEKVEKIVLGSVMGIYRFTQFKTKDKEKEKRLSHITIVTNSADSFENNIQYGSAVAEAVNRTRDLINTPPNIATPEYVANYAKDLANKSRLKCTIIDENEAKRLKMECFLAVASGSANKPRMVVLEYYGADKKQKPIALVGKGITFDSGGLNLKPYPYILNMKDDKGGAIAAFHIIEACARLKLKVNLIVITPLCENMPSGTSYRPDDVLKAYNGMTVEIRNTDAEGRMVLADALSYACSFNPKYIVDIATLTGASMIALGYAGTPFLSTDESLAESIGRASGKSLEKVWRFPLWKEYEDSLKSEIADIKHISDDGDAGVIMGATFLRNFVKDCPWVHIDIGTTAWSKVDKGVLTKGATGATVRLMMEMLREE